MKIVKKYFPKIYKKIISFIYDTYFKSLTSKSMIFLGLIVCILSIINGVSYLLIIPKLILYFTIADFLNCMIYGDCKIGALLLFIIPFLSLLIEILDLTGNNDIWTRSIYKLIELRGNDNQYELIKEKASSLHKIMKDTEEDKDNKK